MALYLVCRRQLKAIDSCLQSGKNPVCDREGVGYSFAGFFLGAYTLFIQLEELLKMPECR